MNKPFEVMDKENLRQTIDQIIKALRIAEGSNYLMFASQFSGELIAIDVYLKIQESERWQEFTKLFESDQKHEVFQDSQIKLCVLTSLSDEELQKLRQGILTSKAIEKGFEGYFEREQMCRDIARRCIEILNVGRGKDSPEYLIAKAFADKHSALFARLFLPLRSRESGEQAIFEELMGTTKDWLKKIEENLKIADEQLAKIVYEG